MKIINNIKNRSTQDLTFKIYSNLFYLIKYFFIVAIEYALYITFYTLNVVNSKKVF